MDLKGKNIVVVDDEELNWFFIHEILEDTNASLKWIKYGQDIIDYVKSGEPVDLILMDIEMPLMDGLEATSIIKNLKPDIKIVAQTAHARPEHRISCINAGCDDYIAKPMKVEELMNIVVKNIQ